MENNLKDDVASFRSEDGDFEVHSAGAHVTRWDTPKAGEMILVSAKSGFGVGVPVRGGIPICFPWFGAPSTWDDDIQLLGGQYANSKHGFARKVNWRLVEEVVGNGDGGEGGSGVAWSVTYELTEEDVAEQGYPDVAPFLAAYRVDFSEDALDLTFAVANTGDEPFRFEAALHTYFQVGDVNRVEVLGLDGVPYSDKADGGTDKVQRGPVVFGPEVDNVYQSDAPLRIVDPARDLVTRIETENSATTVIWNPGPEGAANMADMGDDEWTQFVCVETANALEGAVVVPAGAAHTMRVHYTVARQS